MPTTDPLTYQCRHIFLDGHRCGSRALRHEAFCYYHHTTRKPKAVPAYTDTLSSFDFPNLEDRGAIQAAIVLVLQRIAGGCLDAKRAGLLLYGLQLASANLPKPDKYLRTPDSVEEIIEDPILGPIAPIAELPKSFGKKIEDAISARLIQRSVNLQAVADTVRGVPHVRRGGSIPRRPWGYSLQE